MIDINIFQIIDNNELKITGEPISVDFIRIIANGKNNIIKIGNNVRFGRVVLDLRGDNNIVEISDNTVIRGKILVHNGSKVEIGSGTVFNFNTSEIEARHATNIKIGKNCLFSHMRMSTSDVHSIFDLDTKKRINKDKDIFINDHVWVSFDAFICKGTEIQENCVVGAKSLVSGKFNKNCIIGGNPARILKTNITWDHRAIDEMPEILNS